MKRRLLVPALAVLTAAMLVACARQEAEPVPTATPVPDSSRPAEPAGPVSATPAPTRVAEPYFHTASYRHSTPVPEPTLVSTRQPALTIANVGPLRLEDYPDDIVFFIASGSPFESPSLIRVYNGRVGVVAETLFDPDVHGEPLGFDGWIVRYAAAPDAQSIVATVCTDEGWCQYNLGKYRFEYKNDDYPLASTTLYESRDGGVTWKHLTSFDVPWTAIRVLDPAVHEGDWLVLEGRTPFEVPEEGMPARYPEPILWPSGRPAGELAGPYAVTACQACFHDVERLFELPDGRVVLMDYGSAMDARGLQDQGLQLEDVLALPVPDTAMHLDGTAGQKPVGWFRSAVALQHGLFHRVRGVSGSCLNVRAEPVPSGTVLACMAEHVLLQDRGETAETEDATWHKVKTPAGVVGWVDGFYLE